MAPINSNTVANMSATATAWDDYDLQTDHYAIAYFLSGGYYQNPLYWGNSCYAETGDCTVDGGGGFAYWLTVQSIYIGSTLANQTNVPQDGSVPTFSDQSVWGFLGSGQTPPSGPALSASVWKDAVLATIPVIKLAESAYANQGTNYHLPMFLELFNEIPGPWIQGISNASRTRIYTVMDTNGHEWVSAYGPVTVFEKFIRVFGSGGMPTPDNPAFGRGGWSTSNKQISDSGLMNGDDIGVLYTQPEVDYLQLFWATGINAPNLTLPYVIGGLGLPPLPNNKNSPQIPLFIRDHRSKCKPGDFSLQGIELNYQFVGINGDSGPETPCRN